MKQKYFGLLIVVGYVLIRMLGDIYFWSRLDPFFSYGFEVIFVGLVMVFYRHKRPWFLPPQKQDLYVSLVLLLAGSLTYVAAGLLGMGVPYDLEAPMTIFFLLIVAPVLEELIFRLALWEGIRAISDQAFSTITISTLLFSIGHLVAYWVVPSSIQAFVLYQALYVIPLSVVISFRRHYANSVFSAMLLHFGFNFGFFLASKI